MPLGGGSSLNQLASQPPVQPIQPISQPQPAQAPIQSQLSQSQRFSPQSVIYSSDDIILDGSVQSKRSKAPIIVTIIAIFICAGIGIGLLFLNNLKNESVVVSNNPVIESSFLKYANYLLFGKTDDSKINPFDINQVYEIDNQYNNPEYLNVLGDLYNDFSQSIKESPNNIFKDIPIAKAREYIDFLIWHAKTETLDELKLSEKYENDGKELTEAYISSYYDNIENDGNYLSNLFIDSDKKRAAAIINYWENNEPSMELGEAEMAIAELFSSITKDLKYQCDEYIELSYGSGLYEN